jgi:hypothetical protein
MKSPAHSAKLTRVDAYGALSHEIECNKLYARCYRECRKDGGIKRRDQLGKDASLAGRHGVTIELRLDELARAVEILCVVAR